MKRFMGMMPSDEVKKEQRFKVGDGQLTVTVQSGENGWTILYADGSSQYADEFDTTDNNFNKAIILLNKRFSNVNQEKQK